VFDDQVEEDVEALIPENFLEAKCTGMPNRTMTTPGHVYRGQIPRFYKRVLVRVDEDP